MSWLLMIATPPLLMLAASGLARIETHIETGAQRDSGANPQFRTPGGDNPV
ncbi:hypothetical protein KIH27_19870 [Mycobacterium sp. M1]|uniref:Uncharacterized protein n=1 Tax=Mycolicibacter acidiphilus TaxID=2835306 RepID=A0ABS5RNF1_9MYCO|nr:hypothetical protein [Mycolicibacter acidiphilus]MBS9535846.1 hypothetical protein [Mycolicibacter acidiphilus]